MSRRHLGGIVVAVLAGALLTVSPPGAQAGGTGAGTGGGRQDPQAMASHAARALIAQRAPALKISRHDGFVAKSVISSSGLQYAPYERTWRGLPVVGGDFVVVTDSEGHLLNTSVAQTRKVALATITPRVHKGQATTVARDQLSRVTKSEAPRLVVWQGKTSHLAWETRVSGRDHGEPSSKSVYVDARSGNLLGSREHVAAGTGNGNWEGTVTIPTSGSGSSFSMTNSNASTMRCQNSTGNVTFTGTDDVWGNGVATDRETGCVDAFFSAENMRQM
jgi:Zn-dependent metalloprotease